MSNASSARTSSTRMTGGEAIVALLEAEGFEVVFGCCGHGNIGLLDAVAGSRLAFYSFPNEQLAMHAADAYFRVTNKMAAVTTTIGPGVGNLLNGFLDAYHDCSSVLVVAGDTIRAYEGTDSFQEIDVAAQSDVFRLVANAAIPVRQPENILNAVARGLAFCRSPAPGPVLVSVAMDLFSYVADFDVPRYVRRRPTRAAAVVPDADAIDAAVRALSAAERPAILAGAGILRSGATAELVRFAERAGAPVVTTMSGQSGFPNDHPLHAGNTGSVGSPGAVHVLQNADVVLAIGTRFGELDCCSWLPDRFIPTATKIIQVDINPREIGKAVPVELGLVADAAGFLRAASECLAAADEGPWQRGLAELKAGWQAEVDQLAAEDDVPFTYEPVLADLQSRLPADAVIAAGSGIRHHVGQLYRFRQPHTHLVASGNATMGWITPAIVGAKIARPDVPAVALCGDGDFRSTSEAFGVAAEFGIGAIWIVFNNGAYDIIARYQRRLYNRAFGSTFGKTDGSAPYSPDYVALARAYGGKGWKVVSRKAFRDALDAAIADGGPCLIEVPVQPNIRTRAHGYWDANKYLRHGWNLNPPGGDT
jgi:acetolactate synthase-1/2/3 large subunit